MNRFALYSKCVLTSQGLEEATIVVDQGKIEAVASGQLQFDDFPIHDLGNWVIMPGLIDSHVHINEPGRTEWEGFETATKAAAAGGITTLVDMPLNSNPVTTNVSALDLKIGSSENKRYVNCGFYGGLIPDSYHNLEALINSGVLGIKAFLTHSGIDEFPNVAEHHLRAAIPLLKNYELPMLVHAELDAPHAGLDQLEQNPMSYQAYLASRPKAWEDHAINMLIDLCKELNHHIHVVHLSSSNSITPIKEVKELGYPITVETCPHYLFFDAEAIPDGATLFKCAPPIREKENNQRLWQAVQEEVIDFIVTDHSPSTPEMKALKSGNFKKAWGGIASVQFSLPAIWSKALEMNLSIERINQLMSLNVAKFLKLDHRKGKLSPGYDADIVVWDPEDSFEVQEKDILHRHRVTPYLGLTLQGIVKQTYVNGYKVFDQGTFGSPKGKIVLRS